MKIKNMYSKSGNQVPNQFIIENGETEYFQSYDSIIVKKENGKIYLDERYWDYSVTTGKYRNQFLGENKTEIEKKIKAVQDTNKEIINICFCLFGSRLQTLQNYCLKYL